ncbi:Tyrosine-protein kinase, active site [Sesbania bispinosa]|nr:Tyrosine-protein kinase, active site [Sesbania bispinosa]
MLLYVPLLLSSPYVAGFSRNVSLTFSAVHNEISVKDSEVNGLLKWKDSFDNHSQALLSSWKGTDPCKWEGILCDKYSKSVSSINLANYGLKGNLISLHTLYLQGNNLSSSIPSTIGNLVLLTSLGLSSNNLNGWIPQEMNNITNFKFLQLSNNDFIGHLPPQICSGGSLAFFAADHNRLTGPTPTSLKNCSSLVRIRLEENQIAGNITEDFGTYPNLKYIDLSGNRFYGHISPNWGKCLNLDTLKISNNNISGAIPLQFVEATNLGRLHLSSNNLIGNLPRELGILKSLIEVKINNNHISGNIPTEIGLIRNLQYLNLGGNEFSGTIPKQVVGLPNLLELNLSNNKIKGSIPSEFSQLQPLESLDLSGNSLSGTIPRIVGELRRLQLLNLSHNNLSDTIPSSFDEMSSLISVDISYNQLEGPLPKNQAFLKSPIDSLRNNKGLCGNVTGLALCPTNHSPKSVKVMLLGGQGCVYKVELPTSLVVAVKKLHSLTNEETSNFKAFTSEVQALTELKHRGSLDQMLNNETRAMAFDWKRRVNVVKGVANALSYMHHDCSPPIVHCDISSKNVLLDLEYEAHISDFGTAKFLKPGPCSWTPLVGTLGYIAPEILMGKHPGELMSSLVSSSTALMTYNLFLIDVLDKRPPQPMKSIVGEVIMIATLALACLSENPNSRPTMDQA